jgi:hypothetical protein
MSRTMRRAVLRAVLVLVVAGASGAAATEGRAGSNSLTGCRNTSTGTLDQVKAGLLPLGGACGAGEVAVTWNKRGPRGPQGATGATGAPGVSGWQMVKVTSATDSTSPKLVSVNGPPGKKVIGGGAVASRTFDTAVTSSWPYDTAAGWTAAAIETSPTDQTWCLSAYAICVTALP